MKNFHFYVVISFSLLLLGIVATITNMHFIFSNPGEQSPGFVLGIASIPLLGIPLFIFTILSLKRVYPYLLLTHGLQIFILLLMGGLAILDSYDSSYGIAFILLGIILIQAYQQLNLRRLIFLGIYIVLVTVVGAYMDGIVFSSLSSILFDLFFLVTIAMFNRENMRKASERNKNLQLINDELKSELMDKEKIESKITAIQLDVDEFTFTQAEKDILSLMCDHGLTSNKALSKQLNKSESTVKTQLHSIYEKTGIHKRSSLIAFYRK